MSRSSRTAGLLAGASALVALGVWAVAFHVPGAGWADGVIAQGFIRLQTSFTKLVATWLAGLASAAALGLCCTLLVLAALALGQRGKACGVVVLLVGANVSTQGLKVALAHPRYEAVLGPNQVEAASWPSGHATSAMSMVLALLLVGPARWRPLICAVGGMFVTVIAYAILLLDWHYPSDVVGGFLIALTWALVVAAVIALRAPGAVGRTAWPPARELAVPGRIAISTAALGLALGIAGGIRAFDGAGADLTMAIGTASIGVAALAVVTGFAGLLWR